MGYDFELDQNTIYIGEAENVTSRLKSHKAKEWTQVVVFVSKDGNLTKAHGKYLEGELINKANSVSKAHVLNSQGSGAMLPESDAADMNVFFNKMLQLLPILGVADFEQPTENAFGSNVIDLICTIKGLKATGYMTPKGFLVEKGSQAVAAHRKSAVRTAKKRDELVQKGVLVMTDDHLVFSRDYEFPSSSAAAAVIRGGASSGPMNWKDRKGRTLKTLESQ